MDFLYVFIFREIEWEEKRKKVLVEKEKKKFVKYIKEKLEFNVIYI